MAHFLAGVVEPFSTLPASSFPRSGEYLHSRCRLPAMLVPLQPVRWAKNGYCMLEEVHDPLEGFEYHKLSLKGIETIKAISVSRNDGIADKFLDNCDVHTHENCRKLYCRPHAVHSTQPKDNDDAVPSVSNVTRSNVSTFKPKEQCLFCGEDVTNRSKWNKSVRICATKKIKDEILLRADERSDEWGERVKLRVQGMLLIFYAKN
ncbi:hypothetical protein B566_EDAN016851 [Ephemera danica]|nr:hypothetical protein B566_EDAN016851 [Ephemera danica]